MTESLYLHLSSGRENGGSFQYELNALEVALHLAFQGVPLRVGYEDSIWEDFIPNGIAKIRVPRPAWVNLLFKGTTLVRTPLWLMRFLFRMLHPANQVISPLPSVGKFFPSQESQLVYLVQGPTVGVIHDLMHRYERSFPEAGSTIRRLYRDRHFRLLAVAAKGVCVDSLLGQRQLVESYGVPSSKVDVLPFAVPSYALEEPHDDFDSRYSLPTKFLFYPATLWLHKNHECLFRAMARLVPEFPDIYLVLVGGRGNAESYLKDLAVELGIRDRVQHLGYVDDRDMAGFFRRARAFVMPSFFGPTNIPPLEAMYHGCPALVSNSYEMPEQCGDAAIAFDPKDPESLSKLIARIWTDDDLVQDLAAKGKVRSALYSGVHFTETCASILVRRLGLEQKPPDPL
jgi:glycosyltransferase involved in cell wall biosynthesis